MAQNWYYRHDDKIMGPVTTTELKRLSDAGAIELITLLAQSPDGPWTTARNVRGLFTVQDDRTTSRLRAIPATHAAQPAAVASARSDSARMFGPPFRRLIVVAAGGLLLAGAAATYFRLKPAAPAIVLASSEAVPSASSPSPDESVAIVERATQTDGTVLDDNDRTTPPPKDQADAPDAGERNEHDARPATKPQEEVDARDKQTAEILVEQEADLSSLATGRQNGTGRPQDESTAGKVVADAVATASTSGEDSHRPNPFPWRTPDEALDYALIGGDLWNLRTAEVAAEKWADIRMPLRLVRGAPDRLAVLDRRDEKQKERIRQVRLPDGTWKSPESMFYEARLKEAEPFRLASDFITGDYRRAIFLSQGDLWRATLDWNAGKLTDVTQVTRLGLLRNTPILYWYGNVAWIWGRFDTHKPVLRVNLITGDVQEIPAGDIFVPDGQNSNFSFGSNPAGDLLLRATDEIIYTYDLKTDVVRSYPNKLPGAMLSIERDVGVMGGYETTRLNWLNDHLAIAPTPESYSKLVLLDFQTHKPIVLTPNRGDAFRHVATLPGRKFLDVHENEIVPRDGDPKVPQEKWKRYVLSVADGTRTELPVFFTQGGHWLDDDKLLYTKSDGGLSAVGTWLFDRTTGANTRLMPFKAYGDFWIPERNWLFCHTEDGRLVKLELRDGQAPVVTKLKDEKGNQEALYPIDIREIDLGLTADAADPWTSQPAVPESPTPKTEGDLIGVQIVLQKLADETPEIQAFGIKAYQYATREYSLLGDLCDPQKVTLALVEAYRKNPHPDKNVGEYSRGIDFGKYIDRQRTEKYAAKRARRMSFVDNYKNDPELVEKICGLVGKRFADAILRRPVLDTIHVDNTFNAVISEIGSQLRSQNPR